MSEAHLNSVLHDYADELPRLPVWSAAEARRHARQRRRVRRGASLTTLAIIAGLATALLLSLRSPEHRDVGYARDPAAAATQASLPTVPARGAVADGPSYDCATSFGATGLRHQRFAFAGTITSIALTRTNRQRTSVTFRVDQWLRGGPIRRVSVLMQPPSAYAGAGELGYQIGTRLLVAGDRAGSGYTATGCGFTRYETAAVTQRWRTILRA